MVKEKQLRNIVLEQLESLQREKIQRLADELQKRNIVGGEVSALRMKLKPIDELDIRELYWYAEALNKIKDGDDLSTIDLSNYYSDREIASFKDGFREVGKIDYPITISNVQQVDYDQWAGVINVEDWVKMYESQVIAYNFETQRNPLVKYTTTGEFNTININAKAIKEIKAGLLDGSFIPNTITLNVNTDNSDNEWNYDGKSFYLMNGQFDIIDGFHRYRALISAKKENPDLDLNFKVAIMAFDTKKAKRFISQEDKRTPLPKIYAKSLGGEKENVVVQRLNEDSGSLLFKQISTYGKYVINTTELAALVSSEFTLESNADIMKAKNELKKLFESLFSERPEFLEKRISHKELTVIVRCYSLFKDDAISKILLCLDKIDQFDIKLNPLRFTKGNRKDADKFITSVLK